MICARDTLLIVSLPGVIGDQQCISILPEYFHEVYKMIQWYAQIFWRIMWCLKGNHGNTGSFRPVKTWPRYRTSTAVFIIGKYRLDSTSFDKIESLSQYQIEYESSQGPHFGTIFGIRHVSIVLAFWFILVVWTLFSVNELWNGTTLHCCDIRMRGLWSQGPVLQHG